VRLGRDQAHTVVIPHASVAGWLDDARDAGVQEGKLAVLLRRRCEGARHRHSGECQHRLAG